MQPRSQIELLDQTVQEQNGAKGFETRDQRDPLFHYYFS